MRYFVVDHNSVMSDLRNEIKVTTDIDNADKILLWTDVTSFESGIVQYAKSRRKEVIVLQHGRRGTSRYYPPFNEKIKADKLLVWGNADRQALIQAGQDGRKIFVTGTTVFQHLKPRGSHDGINVVFSPEHWDRPLEENFRVRDELRKLKGVKITTKIIDSPSHNPQDYDNAVVSHRDSPTHLDKCAEVLSTADLVVGISESTFELLAQALDIPVVIMGDWEPKEFSGDPRYLHYRRIISSGSKRASIKTLCQTIKDQLKNPSELKNQRREAVIQEGGINLNAKEEILKHIRA